MGLEFGQKRNAARLSGGAPGLGVLAVDLALDAEQRADLFQLSISAEN
jgi:hypothetical protein